MTSGTEITYNYLGGKLLSFNDEICDGYGGMGNPTTYRNKALVWSHIKHLREYDGVKFDYNANGIRTKKINANSETKYYYADDKLLAEKKHYKQNAMSLLLDDDEEYCYAKNGTIINYLYGIDGATGFTLKILGSPEQTYFYRKNLQGDVTHILDVNKAVVAEYVYDAWGNHKIIADVDGIGSLNPIRYRGYYYDAETKLYYLKSRYYDPEVGRFINMDSIEYLQPERLNGLNLYAYCGNNPVMYVDPNGNFWFLFLAAVLIGGVIQGVKAATSTAVGENPWAAFLGGFVNGALSTVGLALGLAAGGIGGLAITGVLGFFGGFFESAIRQSFYFGDVSWGAAAMYGLSTALTNSLAYVVTGLAFGKISGTTFIERFIKALRPSMAGTMFGVQLDWFMDYFVGLPSFDEWIQRRENTIT